MKSTLMLKKFIITPISGTMNMKELRTFFGGKAAYVENVITINADTINFSCVSSGSNIGYQYFDKDTIPDEWELEYSENLTDLKANNQSISLLNQTTNNLQNNTRWQIKINAKSILQDYLFFKFKESRLFKSINYTDVYSGNINNATYEYIKNNIIGRYKFDSMKFYVKYKDIKIDQSIKKNIILQYNPEFDVDVYSDEYLVTDFSLVNLDIYNFQTLTVQYNQSKSSSLYAFDYYFDIVFSKV